MKTLGTIFTWVIMLAVSIVAFLIDPIKAFAGHSAATSAPLPLIGLMIINQASLSSIYKSFNTIFSEAFAATKVFWTRVAMQVPSKTKTEIYKWLGAFPKMREWIGDRVIQNLSQFEMSVTNKPWELTIEVDREDIEDDTIGLYNPIVQMHGQSTAEQPDEAIFGLLPLGFTTECYDGQYFFDTDHPVGGGTVSNHGGGAGTPWYLLDVSRPIKPLILQNRKDAEFTALDNPADANVFMKKKFIYGSYRRNVAAYGLWQLAFGSKVTLDAAGYEAARVAMMSFKNDAGKPLNVTPNLLVVPPSLEGKARALLMMQKDANGADNPWYNTAELLVVPWLA